MSYHPGGKDLASDDYSEERPRRRRRRRSSRERSSEEERYGEEDLAQEGEEGGERRRLRRHRAPVERPTIKLRTLLIGAGAVVALVVAIGGGWWWYSRTHSPAARMLAEMRNLPLVGLVIADEPSVVDRLRQAIAEEQRDPTAHGPTRPMYIVNGLRQEFIAPAVRRAEDSLLIAAMAARAELIQYLRATDTALCREFSLGGIKEVDKLEAKGRQLYDNTIKTMEAAYRNGHANKDAKFVTPSLQEMGQALQYAGFQKSDFDKLNSFASLSNDVSCDIELKLNQVPPKLPPAWQGPYARYILGN
jgi:hypothetical protein